MWVYASIKYSDHFWNFCDGIKPTKLIKLLVFDVDAYALLCNAILSKAATNPSQYLHHASIIAPIIVPAANTKF